MNKQVAKSILFLSVASILSACGGGGGGSSSEARPSIQSTNTGTKAPSAPSINTVNTGWNKNLTLNENPALFAAENKFKVKPPTTQQKAEIQIAIAETNKLRAEKGLPALKYDANLAAFAQRRAEEIVGRFSHTLPDSNKSYQTEVNAGENIAAGKATGKATVEQWKNSPPHYENLLRSNYKTIGLAMVKVPGSEYGYYWVQIFGTDSTASNYVFDDAQAERRLDNVAANSVSNLADKYQWLQIDNVPIYVGSPRNKGVWESFDSTGYSGQLSSYDDVRFGVVKQNSGSLKVLYTGRNTLYEQMPQTGSAQYVGKAVMTDGKTTNFNLDAQFKANFSDKRLTGVLSEKGKRLVDINAHIRGTSFHSPQNAPVETQGSFFGKHATELGGIFHDKNSGKYGAFGAKR